MSVCSPLTDRDCINATKRTEPCIATCTPQAGRLRTAQLKDNASNQAHAPTTHTLGSDAANQRQKKQKFKLHTSLFT